MTARSNTREDLRKKRIEKKRKRLLLIGLISLAVFIFFGLAALLPKLLLGTPKSLKSQGFTIGNPDAPVKVIQFSSYFCGHCKNFSDTIEPRFLRDYVESGMVFYRYVNFTGNSEAAQQAAIASYCAADQNRFFEYKDLLYTYSAAQDGFSSENLIKYADQVGMDKSGFEDCLKSRDFQAEIEEDLQLAREAGVTGTPSFLVNDQLVYADQLFETIDVLIGD